jgi:Bifunctional DNA primase/polymerase, N-terminal
VLESSRPPQPTPVLPSSRMIPVCWPTSTGACGCGHRPPHGEHDVGKAPLVAAYGRYVTTPPTAAEIARWRRTWPDCNWGELLDGVLEIDCDSDDGLGEATALGLPPAPVMRTGRGRRYRYACPVELCGRRLTKKGRSRAIDVLAGGYVIVEGRHANGRRYEWIVSPSERAPTAAPAWALALLREADVVADPAAVVLPERVDPVAVDGLDALPAWVLRVIRDGHDGRYPSRSEALFAVAVAMMRAGYDDATIAGVLLDARHGISSKPREKGARWLAHELGRARRKRPVGVL